MFVLVTPDKIAAAGVHVTTDEGAAGLDRARHHTASFDDADLLAHIDASLPVDRRAAVEAEVRPFS
jgi:hypothetical protein